MLGERVDDRTVLAIGGADREEFLQGLVTNDVAGLKDGLVYAALLSPQGKYLVDFFLKAESDVILLDVASAHAADLTKRLTMYRLRANVTLADSGLHVQRGIDAPPPGALPDPRDPRMGWRLYGADVGRAPETDWEALRVDCGVPETGIELLANETYILEAGFERLHGVDFRKGCYVGQEVTARMKHKTTLRKGIARVDVDGDAPPPGTDITADGKSAGTLFSVAGGRGLAHLRFDRATDAMQAGTATVTLRQDEG